MLIGTPIRRREDRPHLVGKARFTADIVLPNTLWLHIVRSPYPHARIRGIDVSRARGHAGVYRVLTGEDLKNLMRPLPVTLGHSAAGQLRRYPLAIDKVRFVGEGVVAVVATDPYVAADAAELIGVDYEPLPAVASISEAARPDAVKVHEDWPDGNVVFRSEFAVGDVDRVFDQADAVISLELRQQRLYAAFLEPRAAVAAFDEDQEQLIVWLSTQRPHTLRWAIASCLDVPEYTVRVIAPHVGGGFGAKSPLYPEYIMTAVLAYHLKRPVKWVESRHESFFGTNHARDQIQYVRGAFDRNGVLLALDCTFLSNQGAWWGVVAPRPMVAGTAVQVSGPYKVRAVRSRALAYFSHTTPQSAYRGAGRPEAAFAVERLMEEAASQLGIDPVEMRRRNLLTSGDFPYRAPGGFTIDSGNYVATLEKALDAFQYNKLRARQVEELRSGRLLGIGVSCFIETTSPGWEEVDISVQADGSVIARVGVTDTGQGHITTFSQILGDLLPVPLEAIRILSSDTDVVASGFGTFGSRSTTVVGGALHAAAREIIEKARAVAAEMLEVDKADVELEGNVFYVRGARERAVGWREVAQFAHRMDRRRAAGSMESLRAVGVFNAGGLAVSFGVHCALVEVDQETGQVKVLKYVACDDAGTIVNPEIANGQLVGAIVQGMGQALYESVEYDEGGNLLTTSFLEYALPKAGEIPWIEAMHMSTPSPFNPLGTKGIAEAGTIGAPPTIVNAVLDALRRRGGRQIDMPLTPPRVWSAMLLGKEGG